MPRRTLRSLLWRPDPEVEAREEIEAHIEMLARQFEADGFDPTEASRRARAQFGDPNLLAAECARIADARNRHWSFASFIDEVVQDLRFGGRQLRRRPVLGASLIGLLAVGLATAALAGSLFTEGLLRPLPFPDGERLHLIWETRTDRGKLDNVVGPANFVVWEESLQDIARLAGFVSFPVDLTDGEAPARVLARIVTDGYFDMLGGDPLLGRTFTAEEFLEGQDVVVLGSALWKSRYGADPGVVGQTLEISGDPHQIIGVMPEHFRLDLGPDHAPMGSEGDLWAPLRKSGEWPAAKGRWLQVLAMREPGVGVPVFAHGLEGAIERAQEVRPDFNAGWGARVGSLEEPTRKIRRLPLQMLLGTTLFVLLMVSLNASSLLLSRTMERSEELAVRRAVGAGGVRLFRQLLTETVLVAGSAAILAAGLGRLALEGMHRWIPAVLASGPPPLAEVLAWIGGLSLISWAALLLGASPGLVWIRRLQLGGRGAVGGPAGRLKLREGLVVLQIMLATILLLGSVLMTTSLRRLLEVDAGFDGQGVLSFSVSAPTRASAEVLDFHRRFLQQLEGLPGVTSVGAMTHGLLVGAGAATSYYPLDRPAPEAGQEGVADIRIVRGDLLEALGIELIEGRAFDGREEDPESPSAVVISESVARAHWSDGSALGREISMIWGEEQPRVVVGVVRDVRHRALESAPRDAIYVPLAQDAQRTLTAFVRTTRDPETLIPEVRAVLSEVDPRVPLVAPKTLGGLVDESVGDRRFLVQALAALSLLALVLATAGIFGVVSLGVTARTREIGLRQVLGATPGQILRMCLARVLAAVGVALTLGLMAGVTMSRLFSALLFEIEAHDPWILLGTALVLGLVAGMAGSVPARRASRLAPVDALRME